MKVDLKLKILFIYLFRLQIKLYINKKRFFRVIYLSTIFFFCILTCVLLTRNTAIKRFIIQKKFVIYLIFHY